MQKGELYPPRSVKSFIIYEWWGNKLAPLSFHTRNLSRLCTVFCFRSTRIFDDRVVPAVLVDGVRHSLESAVGEQDVVLSLCVMPVARLLVAEVVVAVVVLDNVLPVVVCLRLKWLFSWCAGAQFNRHKFWPDFWPENRPDFFYSRQ